MTAPRFTMTVRRFDWLLRMRGPSIDAWPAQDHDAALALLRTSPDARQALADSLANEEEAPVADGALLTRMQAVVHRAVAPARPVVRGMRWGALAACLVGGLYFGLAPAEPDHVAELVPTIQATFPATVLAALDQ